MKLSEVTLKCPKCSVWFTPSDERAKELLKKDGYISLCRECYDFKHKPSEQGISEEVLYHRRQKTC